MIGPGGVASFFLYGEPARATDGPFVHVESLDKRSAPANWIIRPHVHTRLTQLFALGAGGGEMTAENTALACAAPCLLLVPPRTVHAFAFIPGTQGQVLTISEELLLGIAERLPGLGALFASARVAGPIGRRDMRHLHLILRQLTAEAAWHAPGHDAALDGLLTLAMVVALRASGSPGAPASRDGQLVARFRQLVEADFRARPGLDAYLAKLNVSEARLRRACRLVAGTSPLRVAHERTLLEAKRLLLQSGASVADIAYRLGFEDAAYFSRFFRVGAGESVREWRKRKEEVLF